MNVKLKAVTPNAEQTIVEIARVSSTRKDKSEDPEKLINYLIKNKHWSPMEHGFLTLEITTSKAIGIQLLRHRSFTFQEFSQRYAEVTDIEPASFRLQAAKNRQSSEAEMFAVAWKPSGRSESFIRPTEGISAEKRVYLAHKVADKINAIKGLYKELLDEGIAKECARMILPMTTQTTIHMTGNLRSWLGFLNIRLDSHAQKEAVDLAKEIALVFKEQFPLVTEATDNFNNFKGMFM